MARSLSTGESWVDRPLDAKRFYELINDVAFEVDWCCSTFGVESPQLVRQTHGKRGQFRGSYNPKLKSVNFTVPYQGVIIHELAHHIHHEEGCRTSHDKRFGQIVQEMIDMVI